MSLISVENLSKSFGSRTLFNGVSFEVGEKEHIGLVGANGTGKSTLFKLLTGSDQPESGGIVRSKSLVLGYMEQFVCKSTEISAYELVLSDFQKLIDAENELLLIADEIENGQADNIDGLLERQQLLQESFERDGGLTFRSRAKSAMTGLGLTDDETRLPISALSGGQRSKISLARLLLSGANLLLLDEPTNHLDIIAIQWLEDYLKSCKCSYIVVSHDRYFLDKVTERTFEIENERLTLWKGNYSQWLIAKKERREIAEHHYENEMREIKRLEAVVVEQKRWNKEKSVKRAESKEKVIEKLREKLEKPESEAAVINFSFDVENEGPTDILRTKELSMSFGSHELYSGVSMEIHRGERVFLLGANGCGKTTLLRQLTNQYKGAGEIRYGLGVTTAYYDQTQESLDDKNTVFDEVWQSVPKLDQTKVRSALAAFLFKGDDVYKIIGELSGGERARVAILKMMLSKANLLLLDEPTNHLDIGSREALEGALENYGGTILMVSHDRYFINKLSDRIYYLTENGVKEFKGGYDKYWEAFNADSVKAAGQRQLEKQSQKTKSGGEDYKKRREAESARRKLSTKVERLESKLNETAGLIENLEKSISGEEAASDYEKLLEFTSKLEKAHEEEAALMQQWEQAAAELEELNS